MSGTPAKYAKLHPDNLAIIRPDATDSIAYVSTAEMVIGTQDPIFAEAERLYMLENPSGCLAAEDETVKRYWMGKASSSPTVIPKR